MDIIKCGHCGIGTTHSDTHIYYRKPESANDYLLMFFKTPFLYKKDGSVTSCEANHYILYPPNTDAYHESFKTGFVNDWIFFSGAMAEELIEKLNIPLSEPFYIGEHSIIESYLSKIRSELSYKRECCEEQISALISEMLIELGRARAYRYTVAHPAYEAISAARKYILSHIEGNISVKTVSAKFGYSVSRFCVLYHQFFNVTPIEDLMNARIERAISLLKYNRTSITETAELCGFSSIHYFSRKFKEITGVPPSHYLS